MDDGGGTRDAARRACDALCAWAAAHFGGGVTPVGASTTVTGGFDSEIHLVQIDGPALPEEWRRPLVLRVKTDSARLPEARREAEIQGWVAGQGYPAPGMLAVFAPGELLDRPVQVMERLPGRTMLDALRRAPWSVVARLRDLAALQAWLHALAPEGFPAQDEDLLDRRLRLTRRTAEVLADADLAEALARVEALAPRLRAGPVAVCHGDFHPLNVLVSDGALGVVDWTDAGLGDPQGDVARTVVLLSVAPIAAQSPAERSVLRAVAPAMARAYLRAYARHRPLDRDRVDLWRPVHLLHGWSQVRGVAAGAFARPDAAEVRARVPEGVADALERRFLHAIAAVGG